MTDGLQDIELEIGRINREPYGTARSLAAEQLVRRVEADGPPEVLAYAYSTLVDSLVWGAEIDKAYVPFTRWVRWFDEHPEHFDDTDRHHLYWSFKWMVGHLSDYPQVPFEQIEQTLADMERRYALAGHGMGGVLLEKFRWAYMRGAPETPELFRLWSTTPRDEFSNCEACEPSEVALYRAEQGEFAEAARLLEQTLADNPSCGSEPEDMLSQLAMCYLELGRPLEAASAYRRSVKSLASSVGDVASTRGRLALFLARGGQPERAVRRIEADQRLLLNADTPYSRLCYLRDVAAATRIIAREDPELGVHLVEVPISTVAELARWSEAQARMLATAFDERAESGAQSRILGERLALEPAAMAIDLSVITPVRPGHGGPTGSGAGAGPGAARVITEGGESSDPAALASRADRLVSRGSLAEAAPLYVEAATAFRARGDLQDAGLAEANAARCAHELEDIPGADAAYRHAIAVLRAADAPIGLVSSVARSWVPLAFEAGTSAEALTLLTTLRGELAAAIAEGDSTALRTELAESLDTHARALATTGEHEQAVALASDAAERFAALGRIADASHSFLLAGKALVAAGDDADAVYHLESAVEGFARVRDHGQRGAAATDLVEALRRLGRDEEADAVARKLG